MKIKAYTETKQNRNIKYFDVIKTLPKVGDEWQGTGRTVLQIIPLRVEKENKKDISQFDFYHVQTIYKNEIYENEIENEYITIRKESLEV